MVLEGVDWFAVAGRINQLSLVPFLGLLWTLWHIPSAPRRTVQGFTFYLVFIGVTIPVGMYCRQQLGTSLANVDWLHGPCEALLTTANLLIVLGLRDALKEAPPGGTHANSASTNASSDDFGGSPSNETETGGIPSKHSARQQAAAECAPHRPWEPLPDNVRQCEGVQARGPSQGSKPAAHHQFLNPNNHANIRGPGALRSRHVLNSNSSSSCCRGSSGLRGVPRVAVKLRAALCLPAVQRGCSYMCAA